MDLKRNFQGKSIDVLITARTILKSFEEHQNELLPLRDNWTPQYIADLKNRINHAISHYLGRDPRSGLKAATRELKILQDEALSLLGDLKVQLEMDFKDNKDRLTEILTTLGYAAHYANARSGDQESLIQHLYTFEENLTAELITEITARGITAQLLDDVKALAEPMREADVEQESHKSSSKELTGEAIEAFNDIYDEIMLICKVARRKYKDNELLRNKFTFSKVEAALNNKRTKGAVKGVDGIEQPKGIEGLENQTDASNLRDDINPDSPPEEDQTN